MALANAEASPISTRSDLVPLELPLSKTWTAKELDKTHKLYNKHIDEWTFLRASYDGVRELVRIQAIERHERESMQNFQRRMAELYGFNYTRSIINLFTFYLFKREPRRDWRGLGEQKDWTAFLDDCDLEGTEFGTYITEEGRNTSTFGHIGILVDKPMGNGDGPRTRAEDLAQGVYPYLATYHPPAILDWSFERDDGGRPYLAFLKLKDDDDLYRLWWPDRWETWKKIEATSDFGTATSRGGAKIVADGVNPLGVIPFVWVYNIRSSTKPIGISDVHDIARIDLSITRNLSQCEEVVNYAAFPMMLAPMLGEERVESADEAGPTAVWEFDPENPQGTKPEWLEAKVGEAIKSILELIQRKVQEIYRASNAGGMAAMEISSVAKSGAALTAEFQMLNSILVQKAVNMEAAERYLVWLWCKWQGIEDVYDDVLIEYARTYDVENLAQDLENTLTSQAIVHSEEFRKAMEKGVVRLMLPAAGEDLLDKIDTEIEQSEELVIRPRRAVEIKTQEEEDLELEKKSAEADKVQADVDKTKADAKKPKEPPPAFGQRAQPFPFGGNNQPAGRGAVAPPEEEEEEEA